MTTEEIIKLVLETSGQQGLSDLTTKATEAAEALTTVKDAAVEVEKKTLDLQAIAGQGKSLFSAFAGGDVPGIIDGLTSLVALVPGVGAFAPAITAVGSAAKTAWPLLKEWYDQLSETSAKIADATKKLNEYKEELLATTAVLKETDFVVKLREAEKTAKETATSREKDRAQLLHSMLDPRGSEVLTDIQQAFHDDRLPARTEEIKKIEDAYQAVVKANQTPGVFGAAPKDRQDIRSQANRARAVKERDAALANMANKDQEEAQALVGRALKGDADAIETLKRLAPEGSTTSEIFRLSSVEEEREQQRARIDAEDQRHAPEERRRNQEIARKAAQEKMRALGRDVMPKIAKGLKRVRSRARAEAAKDAAMGRGLRKLKSPDLVPGLPGSPVRSSSAMSRRQAMEGARAVQLEAAESGRGNISLAQSLREFRARQDAMQDQIARTLTDTQAQQWEKIRRMQETLRGAEQVNRSAQSIGP